MKPLWSRAVEALEDKKATGVVVLDVSGVSSFTDHIVVCTGMSDRQIRAMAQHLMEILGKPFGTEGLEDCHCKLKLLKNPHPAGRPALVL